MIYWFKWPICWSRCNGCHCYFDFNLRYWYICNLILVIKVIQWTPSIALVCRSTVSRWSFNSNNCIKTFVAWWLVNEEMMMILINYCTIYTFLYGILQLSCLIYCAVRSSSTFSRHFWNDIVNNLVYLVKSHRPKFSCVHDAMEHILQKNNKSLKIFPLNGDH